jgi:hypothetical protein
MRHLPADCRPNPAVNFYRNIDSHVIAEIISSQLTAEAGFLSELRMGLDL